MGATNAPPVYAQAFILDRLFVVQLYVFTFLVPCCEVRYDFQVIMMISLYLFSSALKRIHV